MLPHSHLTDGKRRKLLLGVPRDENLCSYLLVMQGRNPQAAFPFTESANPLPVLLCVTELIPRASTKLTRDDRFSLSSVWGTCSVRLKMTGPGPFAFCSLAVRKQYRPNGMKSALRLICIGPSPALRYRQVALLQSGSVGRECLQDCIQRLWGRVCRLALRSGPPQRTAEGPALVLSPEMIFTHN